MKTLSLAVCLSLAALSIPVAERGHAAASLAPRALAGDVLQQVELVPWRLSPGLFDDHLGFTDQILNIGMTRQC